jgi:hypothetical protein
MFNNSFNTYCLKSFSHNIYLDDIFQPKLHNFRIAESPDILTSTNEPADPRWTPPEKFRGEEYTKASEIYW